MGGQWKMHRLEALVLLLCLAVECCAERFKVGYPAINTRTLSANDLKAIADYTRLVYQTDFALDVLGKTSSKVGVSYRGVQSICHPTDGGAEPSFMTYDTPHLFTTLRGLRIMAQKALGLRPAVGDRVGMLQYAFQVVNAYGKEVPSLVGLLHVGSRSKSTAIRGESKLVELVNGVWQPIEAFRLGMESIGRGDYNTNTVYMFQVAEYFMYVLQCTSTSDLYQMYVDGSLQRNENRFGDMNTQDSRMATAITDMYSHPAKGVNFTEGLWGNNSEAIIYRLHGEDSMYRARNQNGNTYRSARLDLVSAVAEVYSQGKFHQLLYRVCDVEGHLGAYEGALDKEEAVRAITSQVSCHVPQQGDKGTIFGVLGLLLLQKVGRLEVFTADMITASSKASWLVSIEMLVSAPDTALPYLAALKNTFESLKTILAGVDGFDVSLSQAGKARLVKASLWLAKMTQLPIPKPLRRMGYNAARAASALVDDILGYTTKATEASHTSLNPFGRFHTEVPILVYTPNSDVRKMLLDMPNDERYKDNAAFHEKVIIYDDNDALMLPVDYDGKSWVLMYESDYPDYMVFQQELSSADFAGEINAKYTNGKNHLRADSQEPDWVARDGHPPEFAELTHTKTWLDGKGAGYAMNNITEGAQRELAKKLGAVEPANSRTKRRSTSDVMGDSANVIAAKMRFGASAPVPRDRVKDLHQNYEWLHRI
eukprot:Sspe_Gene.103096::Locus_78921_Transcript_2_2_Confidence_0.750_Length_2157::g.103096::m.103096